MPAWFQIASIARAEHFEIGHIGFCHLG